MEVQKKISFTFIKSSKPISFLNTKKSEENNGIELIECLEGQTIKVKNAVEERKTELIIPLRDNAKDLFDRVKQSGQIKTTKNVNDIDERPDSELTLDELAARQLIKEATAQQLPDDSNVTKVTTLPLSTDQQLVQNNESTIDDYNNVPVNDFGLAVLRGMGWKESSGIGKRNEVVKPIEPELRPKGMGLGANQILSLKKNIQDSNEKREEELLLVKGAFAKVIGGAHKARYCEVIGFDDELGRVIVKTAINQTILSLNEFLVEPVTKEEYTNNGKVINNVKYEEYKKKHSDYRNKERRDGDSSPCYSGQKDNECRGKGRHVRRSDSHSDKADDKRYVSTSAHYDNEETTRHTSKKEKGYKSRTRDRSRDKSIEKRHKHKKRKKHKDYRRDSDSSETEHRKRR